ncbi:hypothetical protein CYMTET_49684 [Cymbomonas tetramitiformis]|uniref:Uncharacterized protein n=1 Tax=Cymbomonas tetramitiformis TaxID=36881 RepID=A0AAE0BR10_9CHLO|nr:hypothetical protein CYMTET_49684 [Cymbomonas tetramitiformis]
MPQQGSQPQQQAQLQSQQPVLHQSQQQHPQQHPLQQQPPRQSQGPPHGLYLGPDDEREAGELSPERTGGPPRDGVLTPAASSRVSDWDIKPPSKDELRPPAVNPANTVPSPAGLLGRSFSAKTPSLNAALPELAQTSSAPAAITPVVVTTAQHPPTKITHAAPAVEKPQPTIPVARQSGSSALQRDGTNRPTVTSSASTVPSTVAGPPSTQVVSVSLAEPLATPSPAPKRKRLGWGQGLARKSSSDTPVKEDPATPASTPNPALAPADVATTPANPISTTAVADGAPATTATVQIAPLQEAGTVNTTSSPTVFSTTAPGTATSGEAFRTPSALQLPASPSVSVSGTAFNTPGGEPSANSGGVRSRFSATSPLTVTPMSSLASHATAPVAQGSGAVPAARVPAASTAVASPVGAQDSQELPSAVSTEPVAALTAPVTSKPIPSTVPAATVLPSPSSSDPVQDTPSSRSAALPHGPPTPLVPTSSESLAPAASSPLPQGRQQAASTSVPQLSTSKPDGVSSSTAAPFSTVPMAGALTGKVGRAAVAEPEQSVGASAGAGSSAAAVSVVTKEIVVPKALSPKIPASREVVMDEAVTVPSVPAAKVPQTTPKAPLLTPPVPAPSAKGAASTLKPSVPLAGVPPQAPLIAGARPGLVAKDVSPKLAGAGVQALFPPVKGPGATGSTTASLGPAPKVEGRSAKEDEESLERSKSKEDILLDMDKVDSEISQLERALEVIRSQTNSFQGRDRRQTISGEEGSAVDRTEGEGVTSTAQDVDTPAQPEEVCAAVDAEEPDESMEEASPISENGEPTKDERQDSDVPSGENVVRENVTDESKSREEEDIADATSDKQPSDKDNAAGEEEAGLKETEAPAEELSTEADPADGVCAPVSVPDDVEDRPSAVSGESEGAGETDAPVPVESRDTSAVKLEVVGRMLALTPKVEEKDEEEEETEQSDILYLNMFRVRKRQELVATICEENREKLRKAEAAFNSLHYPGIEPSKPVSCQEDMKTVEDFPVWSKNKETHRKLGAHLTLLLRKKHRLQVQKEHRLAREYLVKRKEWLQHLSTMQGHSACDKEAEGQSSEELARTIAKLPTMILDESERNLQCFQSKNGLVLDPQAELELERMVNPWTPEEHRTFTDRYLQYNKDFRKISEFLPNRSVADCIVYYYKHQKDDTSFRRKQQLKKRRQYIEAKRTSTYLAAPNPDERDRGRTSRTAAAAAAAAAAAPHGSETGGREELPPNTRSRVEPRPGAAQAEARSLRGTPQRGGTGAGEVKTEKAGTAGTGFGVIGPEKKGLRSTAAKAGGERAVPVTGERSGRKGLRIQHSAASTDTPELEETGSLGELAASGSAEEPIRTWSQAEKAKYLEAVRRHGRNYESIAKFVGSKSADAVKAFWGRQRKRLNLDKLVSQHEERKRQGGGGMGGNEGAEEEDNEGATADADAEMSTEERSTGAEAQQPVKITVKVKGERSRGGQQAAAEKAAAGAQGAPPVTSSLDALASIAKSELSGAPGPSPALGRASPGAAPVGALDHLAADSLSAAAVLESLGSAPAAEPAASEPASQARAAGAERTPPGAAAVPASSAHSRAADSVKVEANPGSSAEEAAVQQLAQSGPAAAFLAQLGHSGVNPLAAGMSQSQAALGTMGLQSMMGLTNPIAAAAAVAAATAQQPPQPQPQLTNPIAAAAVAAATATAQQQQASQQLQQLLQQQQQQQQGPSQQALQQLRQQQAAQAAAQAAQVAQAAQAAQQPQATIAGLAAGAGGLPAMLAGGGIPGNPYISQLDMAQQMQHLLLNPGFWMAAIANPNSGASPLSHLMSAPSSSASTASAIQQFMPANLAVQQLLQTQAAAAQAAALPQQASSLATQAQQGMVGMAGMAAAAMVQAAMSTKQDEAASAQQQQPAIASLTEAPGVEEKPRVQQPSAPSVPTSIPSAFPGVSHPVMETMQGMRSASAATAIPTAMEADAAIARQAAGLTERVGGAPLPTLMPFLPSSTPATQAAPAAVAASVAPVAPAAPVARLATSAVEAAHIPAASSGQHGPLPPQMVQAQAAPSFSSLVSQAPKTLLEVAEANNARLQAGGGGQASGMWPMAMATAAPHLIGAPGQASVGAARSATEGAEGVLTKPPSGGLSAGAGVAPSVPQNNPARTPQAGTNAGEAERPGPQAHVGQLGAADGTGAEVLRGPGEGGTRPSGPGEHRQPELTVGGSHKAAARHAGVVAAASTVLPVVSGTNASTGEEVPRGAAMGAAVMAQEPRARPLHPGDEPVPEEGRVGTTKVIAPQTVTQTSAAPPQHPPQVAQPGPPHALLPASAAQASKSQPQPQVVPPHTHQTPSQAPRAPTPPTEQPQVPPMLRHPALKQDSPSTPDLNALPVEAHSEGTHGVRPSSAEEGPILALAQQLHSDSARARGTKRAAQEMAAAPDAVAPSHAKSSVPPVMPAVPSVGADQARAALMATQAQVAQAQAAQAAQAQAQAAQAAQAQAQAAQAAQAKAQAAQAAQAQAQAAQAAQAQAQAAQAAQAAHAQAAQAQAAQEVAQAQAAQAQVAQAQAAQTQTAQAQAHTAQVTVTQAQSAQMQAAQVLAGGSTATREPYDPRLPDAGLMERVSNLVAMSSAASPLTAHVSTMAALYAARSENLFGAQQPPSTMVPRAGSPGLSSTLAAAAQARQLAGLALPSSLGLAASLWPGALQDGPSLARAAPDHLASATAALSSGVLGGAGRSALPASGHPALAGTALGPSLALSASFGSTAQHSTLDLAASSMRQAEPDQRRSTDGKGFIEKIVQEHHLQRSGAVHGGTEAATSRGDSTSVTDATNQLRADADEDNHPGKRKRVVEELAAALAPPVHGRAGGEELEPSAKRLQTEPPREGTTESAPHRGLPLPFSAPSAAAPLQASPHIPGMLHAAPHPHLLQQPPYHFSAHPAPAMTSHAAHAAMLAGTLPHHLLHQSGASSHQSLLTQSNSRAQPSLLQASQPAPAAPPVATLSQPFVHSTVPASHWPPTPAPSAEVIAPSASAKVLPSTETAPTEKQS